MLRKLFLFLCGLFSFSFSFAQEKLSEGILTYHITITGEVPTPANEPALTETKSGTMTIYLKDDNVRQDMILEDGYRYSRISNYTTGKDIILQTINTVKYAIEVSMRDTRKKNAAYFNATMEKGKGQKKLGAFDVKEGTLRYKDGSILSFYYVDQYELKHPELFERSPELKGIPAQFDIAMKNGFTTHFELKAIDRQPVANAIFSIPEGYRIINRKEYEKLMR